MTGFSKETINAIARLQQHCPITLSQFKEEFPKYVRPSNRLHAWVRDGLLRKNYMDDTFVLTERAKSLIAAQDVDPSCAPSVALPRRFTTDGIYDGQRFAPMRPGAEDHLMIPSLIGGKRVHRKTQA